MTGRVHDLTSLLLEALAARRAGRLVRRAQDLDRCDDFTRLAGNDFQKGLTYFLVEPGGRDHRFRDLQLESLDSQRERGVLPSRATGHLDIRNPQLRIERLVVCVGDVSP